MNPSRRDEKRDRRCAFEHRQTVDLNAYTQIYIHIQLHTHICIYIYLYMYMYRYVYICMNPSRLDQTEVDDKKNTIAALLG